MKSIFDPKDNAELLERLDKISEQTKPDWGKMNAAQMVVHCQKPLDVAEGTLHIPPLFIGKIFGKMFKNKFLSGKPLAKNGPTAQQFIIKGSPDFEKEKAALAERIKRFGDLREKTVKIEIHPLFGKLTNDEWGKLHYIHLDHHLVQFGV